MNQNNQALDSNSAWYKIRKELKNQLGEFIDQTWLAGLIAKENLETKTLTLIAPTNFIRDYINNNYGHKIRSCCEVNMTMKFIEVVTISKQIFLTK